MKCLLKDFKQSEIEYRHENPYLLTRDTSVIFLSSPFAASCQKPGIVRQGLKIGNDFRHGKSVRYQCDDTYILEGKDQLTCDDGKWNFDPPKCKGKYMGLLNVMGN